MTRRTQALILLCLVTIAAVALPAWAEKRLPNSKAELTLSYAPLVKSAAPAVVNIYTSKKVRVRVSPFLSDPLFRHFFGNKSLPGVNREKIVNSLGSGVIIRPDGLIVTNHHVIAESDQIKVVLSDRREFAATIVLSDERTDLAVLRVNPKGQSLPYLEMGDSEQLEVGDIVLAIGNPFGVGQTVTSGIVSALARTTIGVSDFQFFIQTDAAINPGNSGGALINMAGELVGINTAIFTRSGGSNGIGFATPSNMVNVITTSAAAGRKVVRPWLGASAQTITQGIADSLGLKAPKGVLITNIYKGSTAEKAGLRRGDVILAIDDKQVTDPQSLQFRIATYDIGKQVTFTVLSGGVKRDIRVRMEAPVEDPPRQSTILTGNHPFSGAEISNLSPALAEEMGVNTFEGVIITNLRGRSPAQALGFRVGDIITTINGTAVTSVHQLQFLLRRPTPRWAIAAQRGDQVLSINIGG